MSELEGSIGSVPVIVTRPQAQAQHWCAQLRAAGFQPIALPVLAIAPVEPVAAERALIMELDRYDIVICVSANAAEMGLALLSDYWPQWPTRQTWIAVGPATGRAMAGWLHEVKVGRAGAVSETLLDWPELKAVDGKRVLIIRGETGREVLAHTLRARGALVDHLAVYRRSMPATDMEPLQSLLAAGKRPILTITSGDALQHLLAMVESRYHAALKLCPLIVISGRLEAYAHRSGFSQTHCAVSPAFDDVVHVLDQLMARRKAND